ncbi:MAG: methyltransferase domain-containing protein [Ktedonobacteraceae bacterium]
MTIPKGFREKLLSNSASLSHADTPKQVRFQERAFPMGKMIGVNAYRINRIALKQRLIDGEYALHETPHFLVCTKTAAPTMIVHWFSPKAIDSDLGQYFMEELKPLGILANVESFGDVFGAVVGSICPKNPEQAWHLFGVNTLQRYHTLLTANSHTPHYDSPVDVFATLYRRVCKLVVGASLLDAGCSFGFLPLVVAERVPTLTTVVGADIRTEPFPVTRAIASERHLTAVQYVQADLLTDDVCALGQFDTVTVLHVLEHFNESDMYRVLTNLLEIASHRLIIGVPYEPGEPELAYGHEQLFTPDKLKAVGRWCLEQWHGGQMQCEECAGGLLFLDRPPS